MRLRILYTTSLTLSFLALTGCISESTYGIQASRWSNLSLEQQQAIAASYEKVQHALAEEKQNSEPNPYASQLTVAVYGGRVLMPPFKNYYHYNRATTTIAEGSCKVLVLHSKDSDNEVPLGLCYRDKQLQVDPSHFIYEKRHGSVSLRSSPIWKRGFTYKHVKTTGYARLDNAHIYVIKKTT